MSMVNQRVTISSNVQDMIESYIEKHKQYKDLEKQLKLLRSSIEPFMTDNNLNVVVSMANKGKITLDSLERPVVTSRYTYYNLDLVNPYLSVQARRKCVVNLIDKEALEALEKLKEVPADALNCRVVSTISRFQVSHRC